MAKFGIITTDEVIFAGDRTRIDVSKSFVSADESQTLTLAVKPSAADALISVPSQYLDWCYQAAGSVTISVNVANDSGNQTFTKAVTILDLVAAKLFSSDGDLVPYEPEIMIYLSAQWSSFNVIHYRAKQAIMRWLFNQKIRKTDGTELTDADLYDSGEFNETAVYMALSLIFNGATQEVGDKFSEKAKDYQAKSEKAAANAVIQLNVANSTVPAEVDSFSHRLVRV